MFRVCSVCSGQFEWPFKGALSGIIVLALLIWLVPLWPCIPEGPIMICPLFLVEWSRTWMPDMRNATALSQQLHGYVFSSVEVQHFQFIWRFQQHGININVTRDRMICCYHTRNGILKLILPNQFYCDFYYSSLNNESGNKLQDTFDLF